MTGADEDEEADAEEEQDDDEDEEEDEDSDEDGERGGRRGGGGIGRGGRGGRGKGGCVCKCEPRSCVRKRAGIIRRILFEALSAPATSAPEIQLARLPPQASVGPQRRQAWRPLEAATRFRPTAPLGNRAHLGFRRGTGAAERLALAR